MTLQDKIVLRVWGFGLIALSMFAFLGIITQGNLTELSQFAPLGQWIVFNIIGVAMGVGLVMVTI